MNNSNQDAVTQSLYETELSESQTAEKRNRQLLQLGFVLTFLLYLLFNQHLYLGDATGWSEYLKDGASMTGFAFLVVVVVLMALFLAGVKHHLYLHFGAFGQVFYVVALLIGFALLAEMFSTSASQDVKSRIMLTKDEAYQQTLKNSTTPAAAIGNSQLTSDIATARRKLAQCRERLKQGREPHCKGSAATLHSLLESERKLISAQQTVSVQGQKLNHQRQDKLKADSYNPFVVSLARMMAGLFGGEYGDYVKQAIMCLMMAVAIVFELLHHFLSKVHGQTKQRINDMVLQLAAIKDRQEANSTPAPVTDNSQPFGFVQSGNSSPVTAQQPTQQTGFKYQQRQPAPVKDEQTDKPPFGFVPSAKAEQPTQQETGRTGKHNPVLGKSESHYELPLTEPLQVEPESHNRPSAEGIQSKPVETLSRPSAEGRKSGLYEAWIEAVIGGECKPSVRPTWLWIQKRIAGCETGSRTHDRTRITTMQKALFGRAIADGHMIENPNYTNGRAKYLWSNNK